MELHVKSNPYKFHLSFTSDFMKKYFTKENHNCKYNLFEVITPYFSDLAGNLRH